MLNKLSPDEKKLTPPLFPLPGDRIPYILDENLRFRPEPGFDDGPPAYPWDECWNEPDPWAPQLPEGQPPLPLQYTNDINDLGWDGGGSFPYLDYLTLTPISILDEEPKFDLEGEISVSKRCSKVYTSLFGNCSGDVYRSLLCCMRFWCEICGGKKKKLHKRRKKSMYKKINRGVTLKNLAEIRATAALWVVQQFIFTVPDWERWRFASREGLNQLNGVVRRIMRELFPGSCVVIYIHTTGDKDFSKFNPHINVQIFHRKEEGVRLKFTPGELIAIDDRWARGLRRLGCSGIRGRGENIAGKMVDVKYRYARSVRKVLHMINYMTQPLGPKHLKAWQQDDDGQEMIDLHVRGLKGFQFMRNCDRWANCNYYDTEDTVKEVESVIGEPVTFIGYTSASDVREMLKAGKLEKIGEDLYVERRQRTRNRSP